MTNTKKNGNSNIRAYFYFIFLVFFLLKMNIVKNNFHYQIIFNNIKELTRKKILLNVNNVKNNFQYQIVLKIIELSLPKLTISIKQKYFKKIDK